MELKIEIPEEELKEAVLSVVADRYYSDYTMDRKKWTRSQLNASER